MSNWALVPPQAKKKGALAGLWVHMRFIFHGFKGQREGGWGVGGEDNKSTTAYHCDYVAQSYHLKEGWI